MCPRPGASRWCSSSLSLWGAEFPASYRVGMSDASYGEGERVLGPPQAGTWAGMVTAGMEEALLS